MKKFIVLAIAALITLPSATMAQKTTIQRVTREKTYKTQTHSVSVWYQGEIDFGYATLGKLVDEDGDKYKTDFSRPYIETVHGARITNYAFVGLGLGLQYAYGKVDPDYDNSERWNTLLMPLFVNLKGYYPVNDDFAPYLTVSLGGSVPLTSNWNDSDSTLGGGFYSKFGVGLNYRKFMFDFGLMHQGLADKYGYNTVEKYKMAVNSVYFNIGFKF